MITLYDDARPEKTSTGTLTASITRNENSPIFTQRDYKVKVTDRTALGTEVARVSANDADNVSLKTADTNCFLALFLNFDV